MPSNYTIIDIMRYKLHCSLPIPNCKKKIILCIHVIVINFIKNTCILVYECGNNKYVCLVELMLFLCINSSV